MILYFYLIAHFLIVASRVLYDRSRYLPAGWWAHVRLWRDPEGVRGLDILRRLWRNHRRRCPPVFGRDTRDMWQLQRRQVSAPHCTFLIPMMSDWFISNNLTVWAPLSYLCTVLHILNIIHRIRNGIIRHKENVLSLCWNISYYPISVAAIHISRWIKMSVNNVITLKTHLIIKSFKFDYEQETKSAVQTQTQQ